MKFVSKIAVLVASMFMTLTAQGSGGSGGGAFGKTKFLLQTLTQPEAILAFEGAVNFPESDVTPVLVIPVDEYDDLIAEVEKGVETEGKPFVLSVDMDDGSKRDFTLCHTGYDQEPVFLYVVEGECRN